MVSIDNVECIRNSRLDVRLGGRVLCKVWDIGEVKNIRSLDGGNGELNSGVRDSVVATSGESGYLEPDSKKERSLGLIGGHIKLLVPAEGGCSHILWVCEVFKTNLGGVRRHVWDGVVLYSEKGEAVKIGRVKLFHRTDRGFPDKVCDGDERVVMRVYKGLVPCPYGLILNLDDMGKSSEAIGLHNELECCRAPIVGAIERLLRGNDRIAAGHSRVYVRGASFIK